MNRPKPAPRPVEPPQEPVRCTYPRCKCIVQTSTSNPNPVCPKELDQ